MRYAFTILLIFLYCTSIAQPALNIVYGTLTGNTGYAIVPEQNGYFIAGAGFSPKYSDSLWLNSAIKLYRIDSSGNVLWENDFGGVNQGWETGGSGCAKKTEDDGYVIPGTFRDSASGIFYAVLLKVDSLGDSVWEQTFPGGSYCQFNNCIETLDGSFIAIGVTEDSDTNGNVYLVKVASNGNTLWQKEYGGNQEDDGYQVALLPDGGFILSGFTASFGPGTANNYLIRTDSLGDTIWTRTYGTHQGQNGACQAEPDKDGRFFMFGTWDSVSMNLGPNYVAKLDSGGNIKWIKFVNDSIAIDQARELENGNIVAVGQKLKPGSGLYYGGEIMELDSNGDELWEKLLLYNGPGPYPGAIPYITGTFYDFQSTQDSGFALTGITTYNTDTFTQINEIWLVKTDSVGCIDSCSRVGIEQVNAPNEDLKIYPNPAYSTVTIEWQPTASNAAIVKIYDMLGREVSSQQISGGKAQINVSGLENGLYVVRVMSPSGGGGGGGIFSSAKLAVLK